MSLSLRPILTALGFVVAVALIEQTAREVVHAVEVHNLRAELLAFERSGR